MSNSSKETRILYCKGREEVFLTKERIIQTGLQYLGTPYVFNAPPFQTSCFDCSSFIQYIFSQHGIYLPRSSRQQFHAGTPIPLQNIQRGDLLFFTNKARKNRTGIAKIGHVGLYMGNNQILHTYRQGKMVAISPLRPYWITMLVGARRVI
ncbi:MAG: C40 family peptidase [Ectobacillus sp.]